MIVSPREFDISFLGQFDISFLSHGSLIMGLSGETRLNGYIPQLTFGKFIMKQTLFFFTLIVRFIPSAIDKKWHKYVLNDKQEHAC